MSNAGHPSKPSQAQRSHRNINEFAIKAALLAFSRKRPNIVPPSYHAHSRLRHKQSPETSNAINIGLQKGLISSTGPYSAEHNSKLLDQTELHGARRIGVPAPGEEVTRKEQPENFGTESIGCKKDAAVDETRGRQKIYRRGSLEPEEGYQADVEGHSLDTTIARPWMGLEERTKTLKEPSSASCRMSRPRRSTKIDPRKSASDLRTSPAKRTQASSNEETQNASTNHSLDRRNMIGSTEQAQAGLYSVATAHHHDDNHRKIPQEDENNMELQAHSSAASMIKQRKSLHNYMAKTGDNFERVNALANAIVASNLASSRGSSPSKPSIYSHSQQHESNLEQGFQLEEPKEVFPRMALPRKQLRKTLRKSKHSEDEAEASIDQLPRSHFRLHKHPHKLKEGDRKRWREEISLRSRQRYEGVWAANKGILTSGAQEAIEGNRAGSKKDLVSAMVVKDIWQRSRLPFVVLEEIWSLVDRERIGMLDREEFVVGMWLIDQRLRGRKLPVKVRESVWNSAHGVYGLTVPKHRR